MSVPELIKVALPVAVNSAVGGADSVSVINSGTPVKPSLVTAAATATISGTISSTPLRAKIQQQQQATIGTPFSSSSNDKFDVNTITPSKGKPLPKPPEEFYKDLQQFHDRRATPITHLPKISGRLIDLHSLYSEVTERGGFLKVNMRDEWDELFPALGFREKCVNASAALKHIYRRYLEKYERLNFFGEDPDKMEALEAADAIETGRSRGRYSTIHGAHSGLNAVPMSYNYRQHIVNMDRRRMYHMSTDLHKGSSYEKLMLSLISPLPNEQDFAINVCTLMANESKHTLKLNEYPKLLDCLLAHMGMFCDYSMRQLFESIYTDVRRHSLYGFWRDLLHDRKQILELYRVEQTARCADVTLMEVGKNIADDGDDDDDDDLFAKETNEIIDECLSMDFLTLGRSEGTQDYVGQRVQQIIAILRNLSFMDENLHVFAKNRTFLRFIVMAVNIRWGNIHNQALDIAGNVATELELFDPTTDDLSRSLMATLCDGIEGMDRGVIINCLEILYKLCQKESNEDHILKCLNLELYERICIFLSLNDIMLLIFTLETVYALTSMGTRSCHLIMQVRGVIDQLVSLITVEAQSYGPDGCILMRVVETVPGNMLPMVAQNIANLQSVTVIQKQQHMQQNTTLATTTINTTAQQQQQLLPTQHEQQQLEQKTAATQPLQQQQPQQQQQQQTQPQLQMPQNYTQEDEQYALAWLGATFERAASVESHVEQQELYRMYLSHCQKSGKHSVVNHLKFPSLVRLIFNNNVGPAIVRHTDATEMPGLHYVAIRVRAQPLPIQTKSSQNPQLNKTGADGKLMKGETGSGRKIKKKLKLQQEQQQQKVEPLQPQQQQQQQSPIESVVNKQEIVTSTSSAVTAAEQSISANDAIANTTTQQQELSTKPIITNITTIPIVSEHIKADKINSPAAENEPLQNLNVTAEDKPTTSIMQQQIINLPTLPQQTGEVASVSAQLLIQQQQPQLQVQQQSQLPLQAQQQAQLQVQQQPQLQQQPSSSLIKSLLANKVTQRQQKQKDLTVAPTLQTTTPTNVITSTSQQQQQPIKVASAAISALVNNPLMQNTPVKVGQTTIKPLNPQAVLDKKSAQQIIDSAPPPLAPLSGNNVAKDASGRPVIIANQMLVEILDKKGVDPPIPPATTIIKRKHEETSNIGTESAKRLALEAVASSSNSNKDDVQQQMLVTPSKNAANLYAEFAASILEDEEIEEMPQLPAQILATSTGTATEHLQQSLIIPAKIQQQQPPQMQNVQRQLLFQTNQPPQLKLTAQGTGGAQQQQHIPTAMATIKTDQGLQTVPVILQQSGSNQTQPQLIQQVLQQSAAAQPQQTQYVLATNQQGQTYLVAQSQPPPPPPPPTQTVLVTQTPQQQSQGTKTIIILQQQTMPTSQQQQQILNSAGAGATQKMIMTTPQGQQVLVTQRTPAQGHHQQQFFINPQTGQTTHIQHVPVSSNTGGTNILQRQIIQTTPNQQQTGQISPSLLSQLNHIPATIKLHQPQMQQQPTMMQQQHQPATISRLGKSVSIVQTSAGNQLSSSPIQIPQLQQHQSIIQQHIISGGPTEKRQVVFGSRGIEIKETVITQAAPPPTQTQLNSQTIITKQPSQLQQQQLTIAGQPPQQQQQQIRAVIEQQQQQHPSIIQQKISLPTMHQQQQQQQAQAQTFLSQKISEHSNLMQATLQNKTVSQAQAVVQTVVPQSLAVTQATIKKAAPTQHAIVQIKPQQQVHAIVRPSPSSSAEPPPLAVTGITLATNVNHKQQQQQQQQSEVSKEHKAHETSTTAPPPPPSPIAPPPKVPTPTPPSTPQPPPAQAPPATPSTPIIQPQLPVVPITPVDAHWLYICDWRNCPRRKFKSVNDLQHHACTKHCPDHLDPAAEIFCQWGPGPSLCDGIPRKRYSLMTHIVDRHLTPDSLRTTMQRRIATGTNNIQPTQSPVTIVRNMEPTQRTSTASPALSTSSSSSLPSTGSSAMQAIKRHTADFVNPKELMDENEGPVTKSIRLTAALILRNLVTYTSTAKRSLRSYEPHLANVALSNVESSAAISHILYELNN